MKPVHLLSILARISHKFSTALRYVGAGGDFPGFGTLQGVDPASPPNLHETPASTRPPFARHEFGRCRIRSVSEICILAAALTLAGCGKKNPAVLAEAGLLSYEFTMAQGDRPQTGQPLVIEFWASWCGPCIKLFPHLKKLYGELEGTGIQFAALTQEPLNHVREFIRSQELPYPVGVDREGQFHEALNVKYIPYAVIVDAEGRVVWSGHSGRLSKALIEKSLAPKS